MFETKLYTHNFRQTFREVHNELATVKYVDRLAN